MSWPQWALVLVFSVPALAVAAWIRLLKREMELEKEKKKLH